MGLIKMLIAGFIVGLIARALHPGQDKLGCVLTTALGIVGGMVAGYLGVIIGWYDAGEPAGIVMSVFGAILVLMVLRRIGKPR
ncbi:MAG: GlsB/YeaQ/YmgE family stress response membrane protein [Cardiobacteriaceae bacterium]|nr:GlsB/YeaQ/YmgE family stress response membrane protein [Cardiobacteriaceae bacterium]